MTASKRVLTAARLDLKRNFLPSSVSCPAPCAADSRTVLASTIWTHRVPPFRWSFDAADRHPSADADFPARTGIPLYGCSSRTLCPTVADLQCQSSLIPYLFLCLLPALLILCMAFCAVRSRLTYGSPQSPPLPCSWEVLERLLYTDRQHCRGLYGPCPLLCGQFRPVQAMPSGFFLSYVRPPPANCPNCFWAFYSLQSLFRSECMRRHKKPDL